MGNSQLMNSSNFMEGMANKDTTVKTDFDRFPRRTPQSTMNVPADDKDDASITMQSNQRRPSITLDDLEEEECKNNTNQVDSNYVAHLLPLRSIHKHSTFVSR